ncbi:AfsR/SARP family transcriptional regulator [Actinomadura macra]|uniref:AfsR/SARP family transcriptional regulator n=1 Tax=Actinomadura macra TaxID=46164 RepID=UPI000831F673|nr:BTAD domain-containing putative transcriptional regulator [Actinomadura macra]
MGNEGTDETGGADGVRLELLPSFRCQVGGREVRLSEGICSLVVMVALEETWIARRTVQARLWPDAEPVGAAKRLRQALWRVRRETGGRLLEATTGHIRLVQDVRVDLCEARSLARSVIDRKVPPEPARSADTGVLGRELLHGWTDEKVEVVRVQWDRLRVLALERLAEQSLASGGTVDALELAGTAAAVDAFGEAPHRIMASAHLGRGDHASAWRVYTGYRRLLKRELGLEPSTGFSELFASLR